MVTTITKESSGQPTSVGKRKIVLNEAQKVLARERNRRYNAKSREKKKAYYEANKEKFVEYERNRQLLKTYGISSADYFSMLEDQGGKCKICGTTEPRTKGGKYFAVDHCHRTGVVRGLLCTKCNVALGFYESRAGLLEKYLGAISD